MTVNGLLTMCAVGSVSDPPDLSKREYSQLTCNEATTVITMRRGLQHDTCKTVHLLHPGHDTGPGRVFLCQQCGIPIRNAHVGVYMFGHFFKTGAYKLKYGEHLL
jgi:hypothetical protein